MPTTLDTFIPFDAGAGASVTEGQWRALAEKWMQDGVVAGEGNQFAVAQRAAGADMSVDVATGEARIRGHQGISTAVKNLTIAANASGNPRVDLVVLRADFTNNRVELDVVAGTAAAAPVEPALTQTTVVWEIPLAAIDVANGAASIVTANIRDRRPFRRTLDQLPLKQPVRFATTTALAASTLVGSKRTANANGAFPATDGVTAVAGDRLLDKDHATGAQRGIWRVVDVGSASRPWVLERPYDFDTSADVYDGVWVVVKEGTLYAGTGWLQTANDPITLDTTSQTWVQFPGGAGDLLDKQFLRVATGQDVTSSTTLVNITDLVQAMGANQTWVFDLYLFIVGNGTGDVKLGFDIPTAATILGAVVNGADRATDPGVGTGTIYASAGFNADGASDLYGASALPFLYHVHVICRNGANAGNFQPQFAQATSNGTATTVQADSHMIGERFV